MHVVFGLSLPPDTNSHHREGSGDIGRFAGTRLNGIMSITCQFHVAMWWPNHTAAF